VLALLLPLAAHAAHADPAPPDARLCEAAIAAAEPGTDLPPRLLSAIGVVESGRADPASGTVAPWPWTINVAGVGQTFETRAAAVAAVQAAQQSGIRSIDVGCMQVNLFFHPQAFATLEEAFDPAANVRYAARFLAALHAQTDAWAAAIAAYHSLTPELGAAYARRVAATWPLADRFGLAAWAAARATASLEAEVDPNHVLTPEFRARMIAAAAFRRGQEALHAQPVAVAAAARSPAAALAALEAEVDPRHVLTPEFRAEMMAAAAFRHQQAAARQAPPAPAPAVAETGVFLVAAAGRLKIPGKPE